MRIEIKPVVLPLSETNRKGLSSKGILVDHLNEGDKLVFKGRNLDKWKVTVEEIENGSVGLRFGNFSYSAVSVFDARNQLVIEDNKVVNKESPNLKKGSKIFTLEELPLQVQTTPDSLRGRNIGIVLGDGRGGELKLFLSYSCPSSVNNGNECAIGFTGHECNFDLPNSEIIEAKNEIVIPLI